MRDVSDDDALFVYLYVCVCDWVARSAVYTCIAAFPLPTVSRC